MTCFALTWVWAPVRHKGPQPVMREGRSLPIGGWVAPRWPYSFHVICMDMSWNLRPEMPSGCHQRNSYVFPWEETVATNFYSKIPGSNSSRNSFRMPCYWIFCCFHLFKKKVSKNVQKSINTSEDDSWYYNNLWKAYRNINFNYSKIFFLKKKNH